MERSTSTGRRPISEGHGWVSEDDNLAEMCTGASGNAAKIDLSGQPVPRHLSGAAQEISTQEAQIVPIAIRPKSVTYADAGVDISSGDRAKERIKYLAQKTFNRNVLGGIGGIWRAVPAGSAALEKPHPGQLGRRGGHQAEGGLRAGAAQHGGRRPGEPLRERHRGAGRDAAVFSGLPGHRQAGPRSDRKRGHAGWPTPAAPTAAR